MDKQLKLVNAHSGIEQPFEATDRYKTIISYLEEITGMNLSTVYKIEDVCQSLIEVLPKRSHVLCLSVIESDYNSIKKDEVIFENQSMVNYIIGHNFSDVEFDIGCIAQFGSNVVPTEMRHADNKLDAHSIVEDIKTNNKTIVGNEFFKSAAGAKIMLDMKEAGEDIAKKYIVGTDKVRIVKLMAYNAALLTGVTPFAKREDVKIYTLLR